MSRSVPTAIADPHTFGARPSQPHPPPGAGDPDFEIVRPTRFRVVRQLKGALPGCLDLDVPGGTVGALSSDGFAPAFGVGDRMLAFFTVHDATAPTPWASLLLLTDKNGEVRLPFGGQERLNIDTWTPSPTALLPSASG